MPYKTTIEVDGKTVDVEIPGVVSEVDVSAQFMRKDAFQAELDRRVKSITTGMVKLDDLATNEELKRQALEKLGIKPGDSTKTDEAVADQIAKAREGWTKEFTEREIKPREAVVQKLSTRVQRFVGRSLEQEILASAAAAGVKPALLVPPSPGAKPPVVAMLESAFKFDEDGESWYAKDGDGYKLAPTPTKDRIHMNVAEFVAEWAGRKEMADFVMAQKQDGPGLGGTGGGKNTGDVYLTPEEASDAQTFEAALAKVGGDWSRVKVKQPS